MPTIASPTQLPAISSSHPPAPRQRSGFFAHHGIWAPGVRLFRQMRFVSKALIISMAFVLPTGALVLWLLYMQTTDALENRKALTRQQVEAVHGILVWAHGLEKGDGKAEGLPREQAQKLAAQAIGKLRYNGGEYFWINDMQPRVVMHPIKPELDGKDVGDVKDPTGLALFKAFVDRVKADGKGFVEYRWPKPGHDKPVEKVSFVMGFEPWGWAPASTPATCTKS